jgi:hypothetical protein
MKIIPYNIYSLSYGSYQRGVAAMTTIVFVLAILIILITSYGLITANIARQTTNIINSAQAYYISEAGVEDGIIRYQRSNGTLVGSWDLGSEVFVQGKTDVEITSLPTSNLDSKSDMGGRNRKIHVSLASSEVYTYAVLVGDGGLWMSDSTFIRCVGTPGSGCLGTSEAGDAGLVYVNGDIWANGEESSGTYNYGSADARIVGDVFATGKVDIMPSEKKEPAHSNSFICLGAGDSSYDTACAGKAATAIMQKVRIHRGGKNILRVAFRIAYHGDPSHANFPSVRMYPLREGTSSGDWRYSDRTTLDKDDGNGSTALQYPLSASGGLQVDTPEWVYFNIPTGGIASVNDDTAIYLVLQVESPDPSVIPDINDNYWRIYYDDSTLPATTHTGGNGGYVTNGAFNSVGTICEIDGSPQDCILDPYDPPTDPAISPYYNDLDVTGRSDFHFRLYSLGTPPNRYAQSLSVTGELHADEAWGATVVGKASSADPTDNIGFVGRRFVSTYWRDEKADQKIWGNSFVQQLDSCDISAASGTELGGNDIETRRGSRIFCESDIRDISGFSNYATDRIFDTTLDNYALSTWYCNPYKNAGSVDASDTNDVCLAPGAGDFITPYDFHGLAEGSGIGCWMACGSNGLDCVGDTDGNELFKSYYINEAGSSEFAQPPYNFCEYAPGHSDITTTGELDFKSKIELDLGFTADESDNYLPKGPPAQNFPISDTRIDVWIRDTWGQSVLDGNYSTCIREGTNSGVYVDDVLNDNAFTISASSVDWTQPTCVEGDLVIRAKKLTLDDGAHVYVTGNLLILDEPGLSNGELEMESSGAGEWDSNEAGLLIVNGVIDTEQGSKLRGGQKNKDVFLFAISRSTNMGEYDPLEYDSSGVNDNSAYNEGNQAAIYLRNHQDGGATVSFYAKDGSVVMDDNAGGQAPNAMQISARKLIMRRSADVTYDYGLLDMLLPGGPARTYGVGDYYEDVP